MTSRVEERAPVPMCPFGQCPWSGCNCEYAEIDDPSPYCSYGHKTKAACDCEPIARNE